MNLWLFSNIMVFFLFNCWVNLLFLSNWMNVSFFSNVMMLFFFNNWMGLFFFDWVSLILLDWMVWLIFFHVSFSFLFTFVMDWFFIFGFFIMVVCFWDDFTLFLWGLLSSWDLFFSLSLNFGFSLSCFNFSFWYFSSCLSLFKLNFLIFRLFVSWLLISVIKWFVWSSEISWSGTDTSPFFD